MRILPGFSPHSGFAPLPAHECLMHYARPSIILRTFHGWRFDWGCRVKPAALLYYGRIEPDRLCHNIMTKSGKSAIDLDLERIYCGFVRLRYSHSVVKFWTKVWHVILSFSIHRPFSSKSATAFRTAGSADLARRTRAAGVGFFCCSA